MCNHYRNHERAIADWKEYISWNLPPWHPEQWSEIKIDVWPKRPGLVIREQDGDKVLDQMTWGVPCTMPGKRPGTTVTKHVTNVRNLASPFWKSMLATPARRCLVPFTSFAEPKPGTDPETGRPAEWWFTVNERPLACFAGIWRPTEIGNAYAFLTCEPNPLVAPLHPKAMPVILQESDYEEWLSGDYADACELAQPYPSQLMTVS